MAAPRAAFLALAACFLSLPSLSAPSGKRLDDTYPLLRAVGSDGIPILGFSCRGVPAGENLELAVKSALEQGYRMLDVDAEDSNEESIGRGLAASGVLRSQVFISWQLRDAEHGYAAAHRALRSGLEALDVDYVDLVLQGTGKFIETWDALVEMRWMGVARSVGVATSEVQHLEILAKNKRELPAVVRAEVHPMNWHQRESLVHWCQGRDLVVQAFGLLTDEVLSTGALVDLAASRGGTTPAKLLVAWSHTRGMQLATAAQRHGDLREHARALTLQLTGEELSALSQLGAPASGRRLEARAAPLDLGDIAHTGPGSRAAAQRASGRAVEF